MLTTYKTPLSGKLTFTWCFQKAFKAMNEPTFVTKLAQNWQQTTETVQTKLSLLIISVEKCPEQMIVKICATCWKKLPVKTDSPSGDPWRTGEDLQCNVLPPIVWCSTFLVLLTTRSNLDYKSHLCVIKNEQTALDFIQMLENILFSYGTYFLCARSSSLWSASWALEAFMGFECSTQAPDLTPLSDTEMIIKKTKQKKKC